MDYISTWTLWDQPNQLFNSARVGRPTHRSSWTVNFLESQIKVLGVLILELYKESSTILLLII